MAKAGAQSVPGGAVRTVLRACSLPRRPFARLLVQNPHLRGLLHGLSVPGRGLHFLERRIPRRFCYLVRRFKEKLLRSSVPGSGIPGFGGDDSDTVHGAPCAERDRGRKLPFRGSALLSTLV